MEGYKSNQAYRGFAQGQSPINPASALKAMQAQAFEQAQAGCVTRCDAPQEVEYGLKSAVENLRDVTNDVGSVAYDLRISLGLYDTSGSDSCSASNPSTDAVTVTEMIRIAASRLREAFFDLRRVQSHINS